MDIILYLIQIIQQLYKQNCRYNPGMDVYSVMTLTTVSPLRSFTSFIFLFSGILMVNTSFPLTCMVTSAREIPLSLSFRLIISASHVSPTFLKRLRSLTGVSASSFDVVIFALIRAFFDAVEIRGLIDKTWGLM